MIRYKEHQRFRINAQVDKRQIIKRNFVKLKVIPFE